MTTAALYARISSDPTGQALGVERQLADLRKLAKREGWEPVEYVDNHVSAYKDHARRPAFERLLADAKAGRVQVIAAWHVDRLARHPRALERLIDAAEPHDVPVHTVQAGALDLSTPGGRAIGRTLAAWGGYEVETKAARQRAKCDELATKGLWPG
ncbi:MAG: recombinase family protein, partial [Actinomycetes bacterium]